MSNLFESSDIPALIVSGASFFASLAALSVAWVAIGRSDRNASAATLVTVYQGFRDGWTRYGKAEPEDRRYEMAELMNVFEIACAIHQDRAIHGVSREILEEYLCHTLSIFSEDEDARREVHAMKDAASTFKYVAMFEKQMRRPGRISGDPLLVDL